MIPLFVYLHRLSLTRKLRHSTHAYNYSNFVSSDSIYPTDNWKTSREQRILSTFQRETDHFGEPTKNPVIPAVSIDQHAFPIHLYAHKTTWISAKAQ